MKKNIVLFCAIAILLVAFDQPVLAQETQLSNNIKQPAKSIFKLKNTRDYSNKGKFYVHWGYNFDWYAKSDIRFTGPGYDFTLKDVVAKDRPTKLDLTYINPLEITIPQLNFHFGYYIKDNYTVSIGWDHMKYVAKIPQTVKINGFIGAQISDPADPIDVPLKYQGNFNNESLRVDTDMLRYEHTDGYNYVSAEVERYDDVWVAKNHKQSFNIETGAGAGFIIPRTDAHLFGVGNNHFWNFAGYGVSAKLGGKFFFNHHLFFQGSLKAGWGNLTTIHTTGRNNFDNAKQKIGSLENYYVLGYVI